MDKEELLQELSTKVSVGEISREEVMSRLSVAPTIQREDEESIKKLSHFSVTKMMYILGAAIVVIGIVIFVNVSKVNTTKLRMLNVFLSLILIS